MVSIKNSLTFGENFTLFPGTLSTNLQKGQLPKKRVKEQISYVTELNAANSNEKAKQSEKETVFLKRFAEGDLGKSVKLFSNNSQIP